MKPDISSAHRISLTTHNLERLQIGRMEIMVIDQLNRFDNVRFVLHMQQFVSFLLSTAYRT